MKPVRSSKPSMARPEIEPGVARQHTNLLPQRRRGRRKWQGSGAEPRAPPRAGRTGWRRRARKRSAISPAVRPPTRAIPAMARMSSTKALAACGAWPSMAARSPAYSGEAGVSSRLGRGPSSPASGDDGPHEPALRRRRETERIDQRSEEAHVAEPHRRCAPGPRPSRPSSASATTSASAADASVRPIELDAGLQELAARAGPQPEHRAAVGVAGGRACRRGEMLPADRDRVLRPQAHFAAVRVLRHEHAPPDVLAGEVDEHVGGLQHRRLDARITFALEERDQARRSRRSASSAVV